MDFEKIKNFYDSTYYGDKTKKYQFDLKRHLSWLHDVPNKVNQSEKLLDIGCGDGQVCSLLVGRGYQVFGLEISEEALKNARQKVPKGLFFLSDGSNHLSFKDEEFDLITCLGVLEHVLEPMKMLEECYRVLKKGGMAIFLVPNSWNPYFWVGGTEQIYEEPHSLNAWKSMFEKAEFEVKRVIKDLGPSLSPGLSNTKKMKIYLHKIINFLPLQMTYQFNFTLRK